MSNLLKWSLYRHICTTLKWTSKLLELNEHSKSLKQMSLYFQSFHCFNLTLRQGDNLKLKIEIMWIKLPCCTVIWHSHKQNTLWKSPPHFPYSGIGCDVKSGRRSTLVNSPKLRINKYNGRLLQYSIHQYI